MGDVRAVDWTFDDTVPATLDAFDVQRELAFGTYDTTSRFSAIPVHSCVCFADDLTLVATTGPAHDRESQRYAELFAAAPQMLAALNAALPLLRLAEYAADAAHDFGFRDRLLAAEDAHRAAITAALGEAVLP